MSGFLPWLLMMLMWLASVVFGVVAAAAMVTYMRRTWQLIRSDEDGSKHDQVLDGIDRMETRLSAISERLARIEQRQDPRLEAPVNESPRVRSGPDPDQLDDSPQPASGDSPARQK